MTPTKKRKIDSGEATIGEATIEGFQAFKQQVSGRVTPGRDEHMKHLRALLDDTRNGMKNLLETSMRIELTCEGVEEMDEFQPNLQKCRKQYLDVGEEMKLLCDALADRIGLLEADHVAADKERVEDGNRVLELKTYQISALEAQVSTLLSDLAALKASQ